MNKRACVTNLLETLDFITYNVSQGKPVDNFYADFAKAFDTVNKRLLGIKLEAYGIVDELLNWLMAFLHDRRQRVVIGESVSDWVEVESGVPQGSVLGPILFVIFINDLLDTAKNVGKLYADDSKILSVVSNTNEINEMQRDINRIVKWTIEWDMHLHCTKCKIMHHGINNPCHNYEIFDVTTNESKTLEVTTSERDLGIQITSDLKWHDQVTAAASKANRALGILKRTFSYMDVDLTKKLYCCYVRPHLEFASSVWNPSLKGEIDKLEQIQNRATRIPFQVKGIRSKERLKIFGLQSLYDRRRRGDLIQLYKINRGLDTVKWHHPQTIAPSIQTQGPASAIRGHNQRLTKETVKFEPRHKFFTNRVANDWNKLDHETILAPTLNVFKARIDKHFFHIYLAIF